MKFLTDILMGADKETYDTARVLCFLSHIVYFGMALASYVISKPWGAMDFASGIGTMTVGFGIHLYLKPTEGGK